MVVVTDIVQAQDADDDGVMRAELARRIAMVSAFLKTMTEAIEFGG